MYTVRRKYELIAGRRLTHDEFIYRLNTVKNNEYLVLSQYEKTSINCVKTVAKYI